MILRRLEDTTVLAMEYAGCPGQASRGGRSGGLRVSTSAVISSRLPHILHICMKPEPQGTAVLQLYAMVLLGATIVSIRVQFSLDTAAAASLMATWKSCEAQATPTAAGRLSARVKG